MISYTLTCANEHRFEGWFASSAAFDSQAAGGEIACPHCATTAVAKAPMAPNVARRRDVAGKRDVARKHGSAPPELLDAMRKVRARVEETSEYVGPRLPEEARKIHHEEAEPRGIYGEASIEEAAELAEEGIPLHPLPPLPEDFN